MVATSPPPHPVEPSATLTLSPQRRGPPWTWRPGPRPPHACSEHRAPAPSDPPSAHPTGLPRPQAPRPGGPRSAGARRPGSTGPPLAQPAGGPQIESQTRRRPPPLPPPPTPPGRSGRPYPAPAARGLGQPRTRPTAPLPHPSSRDHACPAPWWAGPGYASFDPGGGALQGDREGRVFCRPAPQDSGGGAACSLLGRQVGFQDTVVT